MRRMVQGGIDFSVAEDCQSLGSGLETDHRSQTDLECGGKGVSPATPLWIVLSLSQVDTT